MTVMDNSGSGGKWPGYENCICVWVIKSPLPHELLQWFNCSI